jgi:hypothetical protein
MKDELDYQALIAEVALIDQDAAEYMQGPMRECFGFSTSGDLWEVVVWEHTAQGTEYWYNIAKQLEKL